MSIGATLAAKGHLFVKESAPDVWTHHLHVVAVDDPQWREWLLFRDKLRADETLRAKYAQIKQALQERFAEDRKGYTSEQNEFIRGLLYRRSKQGRFDLRTNRTSEKPHRRSPRNSPFTRSGEQAGRPLTEDGLQLGSTGPAPPRPGYRHLPRSYRSLPTTMFSENSEVSPTAVPVAVPVMLVAVADGRLSQEDLALAVVGGVPIRYEELDYPALVEVAVYGAGDGRGEREVVPWVAETITGKFWRLLAPVPGSSVSLAVTPSLSRSMPSPPLAKIRLERMLLTVPSETNTPSAPLWAMRLPAALVVPPPCCWKHRRYSRRVHRCPERRSWRRSYL